MARKRIKVSKGMLITWFMLAGLILLLTPHKVTGKFQSAFNAIFRIPLSVGRDLSLSASRDQYVGEMVDRREYDRLTNHLANREQELAEANLKLEKLYGLYNKNVWPAREFVLAGVYKVTLEGLRNEFVMDRGEKSGLRPGQFVLGDNSIVGVVFEVFSGNATVQMVTDSSFQAAVQVGDMRAVLHGVGGGMAKISHLSRKHKINVGEDVFICKQAGALGAAMKLGTVQDCRVDEENPLFWDITVKPACELKRLEDAAVIVTGTGK